MDDDWQSSRRAVIKTVGAAGIAGLAGCSGDGGEGGGGDTETATDSPTDDSTETNGTTTESTAAELEDSITVYANTAMQPLADAFKQETGVNVNMNVLSGPRALGRFNTEYEQGTYEMDVLINAATQSAWNSDKWAEAEPTADPSKLVSDTLKEPLQAENAYGKVWPFYGVLAGYVYNGNNVSEPPTNWEDIPNRDARMGTAGFNTDNIYMALVRGFDQSKANELYPKIYNALDTFPSNHTAGTEQVIGGQLDIMVHTFLGSSLPKNTGPLGISFPSFTANHVEAASISDEAPHPNAANEFVKWLTSQKGQETIRDMGAGLPAFSDIQHGNDLIRGALEEYNPEIFTDVFTQEKHKQLTSKAKSLVEGNE